MSSTPLAPSVLLASALRDLGFAARETIESTAAAVARLGAAPHAVDQFDEHPARAR